MRTAISTLTACLFLLVMSTAASAKSPVQGGLPAVQNRVTELEDRVDNIENAIVTQEDITALESRVESLENEAATKDDVMDLSDHVTALEEENTTLNQRVGDLEQAATMPMPVVKDANGVVVGVVLDQNFPRNDTNDALTVLFEAAVLLEINGIPAIVRVTPNMITGFPPPHADLTFTGLDCEGTAFILGTSLATFGGKALAWDGNLHIPKPEPGVEIALPSRVEILPGSGNLACVNDGFRAVYTEAITVPLSVFDGLTPPFFITGLPSFTSP